MKVNLSLEVTDVQRNVLACIIAGAPRKSLAKREDVRAFVEGCIAGLTEALIPEPPSPKPKDTATYDVGDGRTVEVKKGPNVANDYNEAFWKLLTDEELAIANKFREEGKPDGFIRGYFYIERKRKRGNAQLKDSD